ncbi:MAG: ATP-dependent Clp protease proteolytic subunit [Polymorphobacter sp.]|uniref:ATP-dependent Clp protease proteolytic subunit n=1 Tax=Polymorphobacter sp. TaxID=1909290 RepID=UPI003A8A5018
MLVEESEAMDDQSEEFPWLDSSKNKKGNFLKRHWDGYYSLPRAYWVNTVIISALFIFFISFIIEFFAVEIRSIRLYSFLALLLWPTIIISWLWAIVGTWRSASRHVERGGRPFWAGLARVAIILGAFSMAGQIVTNAIPQAREYANIALGWDPLGEAATIRIASDGRSIEVVGALAEGSSKKFEQILNNASSVETVVLDSVGGRLFEAEAIAEQVRAFRLMTYVEGRCLSACTLILIAGSDRAATPNARIGFHQPDFPGLDSEARSRMIEANRQLYRQAGVAEEFINKAMESAPDRMWYPSHGEMFEAGILTRSSFGGETATAFSSVNSLEELSSLLLEVSLFRTLQETQPELFKSIVGVAWQEKMKGRNDNDILNAARAQLASRIVNIIARADDETLHMYLILILDQVRAAQSVSYEACGLLMAGQLNTYQTLPRSLAAREAALLERALRQNGDSQVNIEAANRGYEIIGKELSPSELTAIAEPENATLEQKCDAMIRFYSVISELPLIERSAIIRDIFSAA